MRNGTEGFGRDVRTDAATDTAPESKRQRTFKSQEVHDEKRISRLARRRADRSGTGPRAVGPGLPAGAGLFVPPSLAVVCRRGAICVGPAVSDAIWPAARQLSQPDDGSAWIRPGLPARV